MCQKSLIFTNAFKFYKQKLKLASFNLANSVEISILVTAANGNNPKIIADDRTLPD